MHEDLILFTQDKNFIRSCNSALPPTIQVLYIRSYSLLEEFLKAHINVSSEIPVLVDWNADFEKIKLEKLGKTTKNHFNFFTSSIYGNKTPGGIHVRKLPFGLLSLVKKRPEKTENKVSVSKKNNSTDKNKTLLSLCGHSVKIEKVRRQIKIAAGQECSVLLTGESGTGKTLAAVIIHSLSKRADHQIVMENVAAISESLAESELFGSVEGAFTGAEKNRKGLFGEADGSTLFLDEAGELSLQMQSKLLQVLQEKIVRPVGDGKPHKVNVRTIFATNADLKQRMEQGIFRKDLYYRMNQLEIRLPALRERPEDIPDLCKSFFSREKLNARVSRKALYEMMKWKWHGNIRELETVLRRAVIYADSGWQECNKDAADFRRTAGRQLIIDLPLIEFCRQDLQL